MKKFYAEDNAYGNNMSGAELYYAFDSKYERDQFVADKPDRRLVVTAKHPGVRRILNNIENGARFKTPADDQ